MGATSSSLRLDEVDELQDATNFSHKEIKRLFKRFQKLDKDGNGNISREEFMDIPQLAVNPLASRVVTIFDKNKDENVNFKEFLQGLSIFSSRGEAKDKLRFAFAVYDIDGDGFITNGELFEVLKMMVGSNLTDHQLQNIVDKTILEADKDGDGKISFEEFVEMLGNTDIENRMTVDF